MTSKIAMLLHPNCTLTISSHTYYVCAIQQSSSRSLATHSVYFVLGHSHGKVRPLRGQVPVGRSMTKLCSLRGGSIQGKGLGQLGGRERLRRLRTSEETGCLIGWCTSFQSNPSPIEVMVVTSQQSKGTRITSGDIRRRDKMASICTLTVEVNRGSGG